MINIIIERKHVYLLTVIVVLMSLLVPINAWASNRFNDVSDSNIFHNDIDWLADSGVTKGCGGGNYCPDDFVTREQMAAFMHRFSTNLTPRAVHSATNDAPDGKDLALATAVSLKAPAAGTIIITGSGQVENFNDSVVFPSRISDCYLTINNMVVAGTWRTVDYGLENGDRVEICATNGAMNVSAGTYIIEFNLVNISADTVVKDASVWAVWIPLDGHGNKPFVP